MGSLHVIGEIIALVIFSSIPRYSILMHNDFKESKLEAIWGSYSLLWDCRALELLISDFVSYGTYLIMPAGRGLTSFLEIPFFSAHVFLACLQSNQQPCLYTKGYIKQKNGISTPQTSYVEDYNFYVEVPLPITNDRNTSSSFFTLSLFSQLSLMMEQKFQLEPLR
jgi:hypothetical protein